jgi:PKD repeat protein
LPSVGNIASYAWSFGDGDTATLTAPEVAHVYLEEGNYMVVLNVTDSEGNWDTKELEVCVLPACGPTADFAWSPSQIRVNNTVTFDASSSARGWDGICYPPIVAYLWDFGDGNLTTTESKTITHVYQAEGNCTVSLTVFDANGSNDTLALQLTVSSSTIPGDVNADGIVNMLDLYKIALNYGKTAPYDTPEIANCDIDSNGIINMLDLYIAAIHYGQTGQ